MISSNPTKQHLLIGLATLVLILAMSETRSNADEATPLTPLQHIKYDAILKLVNDTLNAELKPSERTNLFFDVLDKSGEFLHERGDIVNIWAIRAQAAMFVNELLTAKEAGYRLFQLKAEESSDERVREIVIALESRSLLSKQFPLSCPPGFSEDKFKKAQEGDADAEFELSSLGLLELVFLFI